MIFLEARVRICIVYDCLFPCTIGGAERWYATLARRLVDEGHTVTYVTLRQWDAGAPPDLGAVGVVAVGFPRPLDNALFQAGAFSAGSAWAYLLINALWRLDPAAPLRQLADAVTARLLDMSGDLATIGDVDQLGVQAGVERDDPMGTPRRRAQPHRRREPSGRDPPAHRPLEVCGHGQNRPLRPRVATRPGVP